MKRHYDLLPLVLEQRCTLLRYEQFYSNYDVIFDAFEDALGVDTSDRVALKARYSLTANKDRASKLNSFMQVDSERIHGDHIGGVVPGSWKHILPSELHDQMLDYCRPIAKEWFYE